LKDGSTIRSTIGDIRAWSLDSAKEEARRLQRLIDQGIDPRELELAKVQAKAEAKREMEAALLEKENRSRYTLRALCNAYSDHLEAKGKGSARQARSIFKCHVFEVAPEMADTPAREITAHQVAALVRKVMEQDKTRAAGVLRSYLSAAFNAARKAPFDAKLPSSLIAYGVESNPVEPIATIPVNRGERTLNADELKIYMAALSDESIADLALQLALLAGGQRMAQLLRAKVSDYDQETEILRLWDKKGRRTTPPRASPTPSTQGRSHSRDAACDGEKRRKASCCFLPMAPPPWWKQHPENVPFRFAKLWAVKPSTCATFAVHAKP
jgi:hypothetical protein